MDVVVVVVLVCVVAGGEGDAVVQVLVQVQSAHFVGQNETTAGSLHDSRVQMSGSGRSQRPSGTGLGVGESDTSRDGDAVGANEGTAVGQFEHIAGQISRRGANKPHELRQPRHNDGS